MSRKLATELKIFKTCLSIFCNRFAPTQAIYCLPAIAWLIQTLRIKREETMKNFKNGVLGLSLVLALAGCAAHSPMIMKNTVDVDANPNVKAAAHNNKVLFVENTLPSNVKYDVLGEINIGKIWYGGGDALLDEMADKARALGADAVIEVGTWKQPSGFAWAAPHASGKAIKLLNKKSVDMKALAGIWR
jgi:hypothetical protein